jgi:hypothetical protein
MKHALRRFTLFTMAVIICIASMSFAQEDKKFATKGVFELGGNFSFQSQTPINNGKTEESYTLFSFAPYISYFLTDGFEIGLNPLSISTWKYSGTTSTQISFIVAPSYNFKTEGIIYPFIEAQFGYSTVSFSSSGSSSDGFCWGGRGGIKLAVTGKGLLNLGVEYNQITLNPKGANNRNGTNALAVSAGFTLWS